MSATQNWSGQEDEAQFLKDLEEAKRKSLESYNTECRMYTAPTSQTSQPHQFMASTPFTGQNGSRQPTPFSAQVLYPIARSQSVPFVEGINPLPGPRAPFSVGFNLSTPGPAFLQNSLQSPRLPFHFAQTPRPVLPPNFSAKNNNNNNNGNHNHDRRNSYSPASSSNVLQKINSNNPSSNPYQRLSEELKTFTDDLIDLGQDDGRNVLEAFDPLFDKPAVPVAKSSEEAQNQVVPELPIPSPRNGKRSQSPEEEELKDAIREKSQSQSDSSTGDITSYGWKPEFSLPPSVSPVPSSSACFEDPDDRDPDSAVIYDAYNQFEYLYHLSISSETSSFYWQPEASAYSSGRPPSPSKSSASYVSSESVRRAKRRSADNIKRRGKLYEDITSLKKIAQNDCELIAFVEMLQRLQVSVRESQSKGKFTYIKSPTRPSKCWTKGLTLKIVVWNEHLSVEPVSFTCDVTAPVEVVIEQALAKMEIGGEDGTGENYMLRVKGYDEYFEPRKRLIDYVFVQECIKLDEDIRLVLMSKNSMEKGLWARPMQAPETLEKIQPEDIMPSYSSKVITFLEISKFLEFIDSESEKLNEKVSGKEAPSPVNPTPLMQTVKGICVLLGNIQTVEIRHNLKEFVKACEKWNADLQKLDQVPHTRRTIIGEDQDSRYSFVEIVKEKSPLEVNKESVQRTKENVIESVRLMIEIYSKSFPVSFQMKSPLEAVVSEPESGPRKMSEMLDPFVIRVSALHRMKSVWLSSYQDFYVSVEVYHGTRFLGKQPTFVSTVTKMDDYLFFNSVIFDTWVDFEHLPMCILPKECRVVFTVYGRKLSESGDPEETTPVELGWASMQCFDFQGVLAKGNQLLPLWPVGMAQKRLGPAPNSAFSYDFNVPLITVEFPYFSRTLKFPSIPFSNHLSRDFESLDPESQALLKEIIENPTFSRISEEREREIFWEKRHYLYKFPTALPKILLVAPLWDYASLSELHNMMNNWEALSPTDALQLLLPCYPDEKVRGTAIKWISVMPDEHLITMLPQLVEALSYETFDLSPLAEFLLQKSLVRFEIAHALFWNLVSEVGLGKWGSPSEVGCVQFIDPILPDEQTDPRRRRLELMRNSLMVTCYYKWKAALIAEFKLMQELSDVTTLVKMAQPNQRSSVLSQQLKRLDLRLFSGQAVYSLPLSPACIVTSLDVDSCICYNSASVPLKINFKSAVTEGGIIPVLFKQGDDIRQDMLTIQVIRMIETWWLNEGLDLRVVTFTCVPTGAKQGVVEIVQNAETLCKIQADYGVTGAFRNRPISEWLAKMNPSTLDYRRAVENFTRSCAAYCVLTYVLGICDRHNDNIMLTVKGHLFHIDFGKFLGDAQMFGSFKRDRAPFVLTSDMLFVINEGEKESQRYHEFVELCCQAFRIVRQKGSILMNLFAMMATAGIPGVDIKSVAYVQNALLPDCSHVEAAARFTRLIDDSVKNWFTPVNFFIHSLAQLRFASDSSDNPTTLSFMPKMYSIDTEGRIEYAEIVGFKKQYDPDKFYSYRVKVKRKDQNEPSYVNRTYKQFLELYSKLCLNYPMAIRSLKGLPRSSGIGRTNVQQVAERRRILIQAFLDSLFRLADEVAHTDLVYTFFHPLLQDEGYIEQERAVREAERTMNSPVKIHGGIKLCIQYSKGALLVLVLHAFDLACPNGQPPSPYVKCYLKPDPQRMTKQKTRVVKRSQHPTFMEMVEYKMPLEQIVKRTLHVSVWHHDPLQENNFLGGVIIPLRGFPLDTETTKIFQLGNLPVSS